MVVAVLVVRIEGNEVVVVVVVVVVVAVVAVVVGRVQSEILHFISSSLQKIVSFFLTYGFCGCCCGCCCSSS